MVDALRSVMLPARLERAVPERRSSGTSTPAESIDYVRGVAIAGDMQERIRSDSFNRLLSLMEAAPSAPSIEFRDVSGVYGLEYVAAVRKPHRFSRKGHERNG